MRRMRQVLTALLALGAGGLLLRESMGSTSRPAPSSPPAMPPTPVHVGKVRRGPVAHPIRAAGVVRSKNQFDLGFLIGGEVTYVGVDVGSHVRRGQVLAQINRVQVSADAERARAATLQARRELDRVGALEKSGALPQAALDSAQTGHTIADSQRRSAEFALNHSALVAPDEGYINARHIDPGELVAPGQPVLSMTGKGRGVVVQVNLTDRDVVGLEVGRPARVTIDAIAGTSSSAQVSQIAPAASPGSGTFSVELRIDAPPTQFKSGMTAKVEIERLVQVGSVIPVSAVVPDDVYGSAVVALAGDTVRRHRVDVLFFEGMDVAVQQPLAGVDEVATEGATALNDDAKVRVVRP